MSGNANNIRVSVIIPVYNSEDTIASAIGSVLAQEFDGFEAIVVNDGSTDGSARIIESYGDKIRVVSQPNRGPASARNAGVAVARGDLLAFLDNDDEWMPHKLAKTVAALDDNPSAILVYSDFIAIENGKESLYVVGGPPSRQRMLQGGICILPSALVMRRTALDACGGWCEKFRRPGHEENWLWLIAHEQGEFAYVREPLVRYRMTDFAEVADKYEGGRLIFLRMVRERYGRAAMPYMRCFNSWFAASLWRKAVRQMSTGERRAAVGRFIRALRMSPSHVIRKEIIGDALRPHKYRRVVQVLLARNKTA